MRRKKYSKIWKFDKGKLGKLFLLECKALNGVCLCPCTSFIHLFAIYPSILVRALSIASGVEKE